MYKRYAIVKMPSLIYLFLMSSIVMLFLVSRFTNKMFFHCSNFVIDLDHPGRKTSLCNGLQIVILMYGRRTYLWYIFKWKNPIIQDLKSTKASVHLKCFHLPQIVAISCLLAAQASPLGFFGTGIDVDSEAKADIGSGLSLGGAGRGEGRGSIGVGMDVGMGIAGRGEGRSDIGVGMGDAARGSGRVSMSVGIGGAIRGEGKGDIGVGMGGAARESGRVSHQGSEGGSRGYGSREYSSENGSSSHLDHDFKQVSL